MKTIKILTPVVLDITDDEYEKLKETAVDELSMDNIYVEISVPNWLINRVREEGKPLGNGIIMKGSWR